MANAYTVGTRIQTASGYIYEAVGERTTKTHGTRMMWKEIKTEGKHGPRFALHLDGTEKIVKPSIAEDFENFLKGDWEPA